MRLSRSPSLQATAREKTLRFAHTQPCGSFNPVGERDHPAATNQPRSLGDQLWLVCYVALRVFAPDDIRYDLRLRARSTTMRYAQEDGRQ